jgi:hypothetical protein
MFAAARMRDETVSLVRLARDACASDPGVEVERAARPSSDLAVIWFERAQRLQPSDDVKYAVRFFRAVFSGVDRAVVINPGRCRSRSRSRFASAS